MILPYQVFFEPTLSFLNWAKKHLRGHMIIDCGAGVGALALQFKLIGLPVIAIDICERESYETLVLRKDSTTFEFPTNSVAIIARPSRGDWIGKTIKRALESCSFILYIGLLEHIEEDLHCFGGSYSERVFENAGKDGEVVYKITKYALVETDKQEYFLLKKMVAKGVFMTSWQQSTGDKWTNFNGGWCPKDQTDVILETALASDVHELDWRKTDLVSDKHTSGWLDREGRFTGCESTSHDLVADLVFGKSVDEMETSGMVRIYDKELWACERRMSPEQRNYMLHAGFDISRDGD